MLTNLAEDVIFALIRYEGREMLSNNAVPVWSIVLIEESLDVLSNSLLLVSFIHDFIYLGHEVFLHVVTNFLDNPANVSLSGSHIIDSI